MLHINNTFYMFIVELRLGNLVKGAALQTHFLFSTVQYIIILKDFKRGWTNKVWLRLRLNDSVLI